MAGRIDQQILDLGLELPQVAEAQGNYLPWVKTGKLVFISGQLPLMDGKPHFLGTLGEDIDIDMGYQAALLCGLNLIGQLKAACGGDLDRVVKVVKLGGFVNSAPAFTDQPKVINGASDLMVAVFAERGRHARAAVGVASLPLGVSVEIDGIFEVA